MPVALRFELLPVKRASVLSGLTIALDVWLPGSNDKGEPDRWPSRYGTGYKKRVSHPQLWEEVLQLQACRFLSAGA